MNAVVPPDERMSVAEYLELEAASLVKHEYVHGIPFRRYRHNLWLLTFLDGLMVSTFLAGLILVIAGSVMVLIFAPRGDAPAGATATN